MATFPPSSLSRRAGFTMSTFLTNWSGEPARSTSWIAAIWILPAGIGSTNAGLSSSPAPSKTSVVPAVTPDPLRRIGYRDPSTGKSLVFLTNNFTVPALTIAQLYQGRWQIELFFKWIKQQLRGAFLNQ